MQNVTIQATSLNRQHYSPVQSCRLNRNVLRWHNAQEQDKVMDISQTVHVAKRYGSGCKPEPAAANDKYIT
ncbi:MAG: hypothetical protein AAB332_04945 [Planctomycetota bacterium]